MTAENNIRTCPVGTDEFPWTNEEWKRAGEKYAFPPMKGSGKASGAELYPIVDSFGWIKRILPLGVTTVQLRIKDLKGKELENEIARSIELAVKYGCRLFINDYWELAARHGAYGVHLGQADLLTADLDFIQKSGLRLGISTHCHFEASKAYRLRPSYIAFGPVYETRLKFMPFPPQGTGRLKLWREMFDCPLVAIGGITLENAREVLKAKPEFVSVVRDITLSPDPEERIGKWRELLEFHSEVKNECIA